MPTNRPHRTLCTHYMHAPMVGNNVIPLAIHAAQFHDIVNNMRLAVRLRNINLDRWYTLYSVYAILAMSSNP